MKRWTSIAYLAVALGWGCSGEPTSVEEGRTPHSSRFGLISMTYSHQWSQTQQDPNQQTQLDTSAQFVRYSAMNREQVARLLALPLDPDRDLPQPNQCQLVDLGLDPVTKTTVDAEDPGNVELLEAGELQIQTQNGKVTLSPKHFPGLLPFISGVVYAEAQATAILEPGKVQAISQGGEAIGPFAAELNSPSVPRLIQVGRNEPMAQTTLERGSDLSLRWEQGLNLNEVTYVELRFNQGKGEKALRCNPPQDGVFTIPGAMLADMGTSRVTLEVARLRRTFFTANGLDFGELRLTAVDSIQLQ